MEAPVIAQSSGWELAPSPKGELLPSLIAAAGERAGVRFLEFFASTIRNLHTRRAYGRAVKDFLAWCDNHAVPSIPELRHMLDQAAGTAKGWFTGPPYAVAETVFDEDDLEGYTPGEDDPA